MDVEKVAQAISSPRLSSYQKLVGGDVSQALELYRLNTVLSGAFAFPLQALEVALRNGLSHELNAFFGDKEWLVNIPHASNREVWSDEQLGAIMDCWNRARRLKRPIAQDDIIADLHFGFWTQFLDKPRHRLWPVLEKTFPNLPAGMQRGALFDELNLIRKFRNRIAHHEIIVNRDVAPTVIHNRILEALRWVQLDKSDWAKSNSEVGHAWKLIVERAKAHNWQGIPSSL